ncbi:hypothetical protein [Mastigocladopsis repens]|uniref:hypothetical protein n=1 Tax=Mastigocladopsis repens TaxID=221287 RepID=UPI0002D61504|nr:hypothetical protein [Mastigocladopsis repens]
MASHQLQQAIGTLPNRKSAVQALDKLRSLNFPMHKVSVITKKPKLDSADTTEKSNMTSAKGAVAGGVAGATAGGLLVLGGGFAALLIPGIGSALTAGSVLMALLGSASAGGLLGAVRGWFFPEEVAQLYNDRIYQKDYLLTLKGTQEEICRAEPILKQCGIENWRVFDP